MKYLFVLGLIFVSHYSYASKECEDWFGKSSVTKGKECLIGCAVIPVDMGTFSCANECDQLCQEDYATSSMFSLVSVYPGLTVQERALATQNPTKMLTAYKLSWKVEELCLKLYRASVVNDESDACRHFIWAGLLTKEFGSSFASAVLSAHEADAQEPDRERKMDEANNKIGIGEAEGLIKSKKFSEEALLKRFQEQRDQNKLTIIRKNPGNRR